MKCRWLVLALVFWGCGTDEGAPQQAPAVGGAAGAAGAPAIACEVPDAQLLHRIHQGATLQFSVITQGRPEVGTSADLDAASPKSWTQAASLTLSDLGRVKVFARLADGECPELFAHVYDVQDAYLGAAGTSEDAIAPDDPRIVGWAQAFESPVEYGTDVEETFMTPERALGPAQGNAVDVVALGNGGAISLRFDPPLRDGPGPDLAVFENGFSDTFLELAYVEVSSDGEHFVRFDSAYLGEAEVGAYDNHEPALISGLAGKYRQGFGSPFDLALLRYRAAVQEGSVRLGEIAYVRLVDIIGDGQAEDAFSHPIYDPTPTTGSAGFDLDGVAALHVSAGE